MKKLKIAIGVLAAAGLMTALVLGYQARTKLRAENGRLRQEIERLTPLDTDSQSADAQPRGGSPLTAEQRRELLRMRGQVGVLRQERKELGQLRAENRQLGSKWVEQVLGGKKLSLQEVAPYLEAKQRNAESLLAAFRATGDTNLLREAVEKYPNDPRVNFAAIFKSGSPQERRQRLDALVQVAPDNALGNYLSARDYFKAGQTDQAVEELLAAANKPKFQDYSGDTMESLEEAYSAAGYLPVAAKAVAAFSLELPHLAELRGLGQSLGELADRYRQGGDEASAQTALQMGVDLGRQVSESTGQTTLIQDLVGIAIERNLLNTLDPASPYNSDGQTVKNRLDELARRRQTIKDIAGGDNVLETLRVLPEQDQLAFFDRMKTSGELEALRWAKNRQTPK